MKKPLLALSLIIVSALTLKAQQDAQYTQFMFNRLTYNPGFAGSEEKKICATAMYRTQWVGFGNETKGLSPETFLGNIHSPVGESLGVGLNISSDKLGFEQSLNAILSVAYKFRFKDGGILAPGVGLGLMQKSLDGGKLKPLQTGDNLIPTSSVNGSNFDCNFGLYYTRPSLWIFDKFYTGLSATHLNEGGITYGNVTTQMKMHYYGIIGSVYNLNPSLAIEPNILVKKDPAKWTTDINVFAMYNNKFRGGLTYRTIDAVAVLLGFKFTPSLQMGYSYDITTSKILQFSSGSHEIMLQYCFWPKFKDTPPPTPIPRLTPRFL